MFVCLFVCFRRIIWVQNLPNLPCISPRYQFSLVLPCLNRFVLIVMSDFALKQTSMNAKCFQVLATRKHIAKIMMVLIAALVCLDTLATAQSA